jgi:hypothetical protein
MRNRWSDCRPVEFLPAPLRTAQRPLLPVGTRSLLWGVHQVLWHPVVVTLAWKQYHGRWPSWRECVCILIHDWGYWGCRSMDGEDGERHPELGARIAGRLLGQEYHDLALLHSRHYAAAAAVEPSALCWPDKLAQACEPVWWYLLRARASGELREYRRECAELGLFPAEGSDADWLRWYNDYARGVVARKAKPIRPVRPLEAK